MCHALGMFAVAAFLAADVPADPRHDETVLGRHILVRGIDQDRNARAATQFVDLAEQLPLARTKSDEAGLLRDIDAGLKMF